MYWKEIQEGVVLNIRVAPKAIKSEVVGSEGDVLRVRIAAQPEKGKANEELLRCLAKAFGVSKTQIVLISGDASRQKKVLLKGQSSSILSQLSNK